MKVQEIRTDSELQPEKRLNVKKRKKKRLKFFINLVLFILAIVALVVFALSAVFNINRIEVKGGQHYKSEDIIKSTGITLGQNGFKTFGFDIKGLLLFRYRAAEQKITYTHPYIKKSIVSFKIPNKVSISIVERKPIAAISYMGLNLLLDEENYVLDTPPASKNSSLPILKGLKFSRYEIGHALPVDNTEAIEKIKRIFSLFAHSDAKSTVKLSGLIKYIDVRDIYNVKVMLDSRILVNFGNMDDMDYKLDFLKEIYSKNLKKTDKGYLDFSSGKYPNFRPEY